MKFIKISLYLIVGFFVIAVLAVGVILASFDTDKYEAVISKEVKKTTGRELTIGNIEFSLFPWLGFEVRQLALSNAAGFDAEHMAKVARLDAHIELISLFKGDIRVDTVRVHELQLFLGKNKQAQTNWDDILQKLAADSDAVDQGKSEDEDKDAAEEASSILAVSINGVSFKDGTVQWEDASTGQSVSVGQLNLQTGAIRPNKALPLSLSADVSLSEPQASIKLDLQASVEFDQAFQQISVKGLEINTAVKTSGLPGGEMQADIKTDIRLDLQKQTARLSDLNIQSGGLELRVQADATQLSDAPQVKGKITLKRFDPTALVKLLAIELPVMSSSEVLKSAAMQVDFSATETSLNLQSLLINLDQSAIKGGLSVRQFDKPIIKYQLALDQINLDDYLPPAEEKPAADSAAPANVRANAAKADVPIDLPVDMLRGLNISGEFKLGKLQAFEQSISNFRVVTSAAGGLIKLREIKASLLEGSLSASAQLDVRKKTPQYALKLNATEINADSVLSPILQKMSGKEEMRLSGKSNVSLDVKSRGQSVNALTANSNGQFKFSMGKAQLYGMDAEYFVRQGVIGYLEKKQYPVPEKWRKTYQPRDTTALKKAQATAVIRNGVIDNRDLLLDSSRFKITGAGKINLVKEVLDYRAVVDVNPVETKTAADRVLDVPMPVFVRGGFAQPEVSIDTRVWRKSVGKELKAEVKKEIKQAIKKENKEKIKVKKEKAKEKLKDKLRGLFK